MAAVSSEIAERSDTAPRRVFLISESSVVIAEIDEISVTEAVISSSRASNLVSVVSSKDFCSLTITLTSLDSFTHSSD